MKLTDEEIQRDVEAANRWIKRLKRLMRDAPSNIAANVEGGAIDFFVKLDPDKPFLDLEAGGVPHDSFEQVDSVYTPFEIGGGDPYCS